MSIAAIDAGQIDCAIAPVETADKRKLHRLRAVREQQKLSIRTVARRLETSVTDAEDQECPGTDMPLTLLYEWQKALEVPVSELLVDHQLDLSPPVYERARMVRLMKTVASLLEHIESKRAQRIVQMLMEQLCEIMPELEDIGPWQASGSQRGLDDLGKAFDRSFSSALIDA